MVALEPKFLLVLFLFLSVRLNKSHYCLIVLLVYTHDDHPAW